ncbi:hypothetical protein JRO89_XS01G0003000 [Xanthoceras sorbifolium]|uniref:Very-long-chain aldehyde decarbonylase CER1-like C-terminal domain-containing protein n=1 Tax=Xanthoceras sorbifolium TaxID=99658 RepID=A0ABQ8IHI9_9ROSI|nr:hypothetical protein JRO89_XS01G0003000 [Xanthoceras sorbifolium]
MWVMRPFTIWSAVLTWIYGRTFVSDSHTFEKLRMQSWVGEELNRNGEMFVKRNPKLKVKVVDGSSLTVAVVLNSIPPGTTQVVLRGKLSKVARAIAFGLCQRGIQVAMLHEEEYNKLKIMSTKCGTNLVLTKTYHHQRIWLVGEGLTDEEQNKASKGTIFIPFSQFPPMKIRKDCFYHTTPAMITPPSLHNLHSCELQVPGIGAMGASQYLLIHSQRRKGEGPRQLSAFPVYAMENSSQPDLDNPLSLPDFQRQ